MKYKESFLNWGAISRRICGDRTRITQHYSGKKYINKVIWLRRIEQIIINYLPTLIDDE